MSSDTRLGTSPKSLQSGDRWDGPSLLMIALDAADGRLVVGRMLAFFGPPKASSHRGEQSELGMQLTEKWARWAGLLQNQSGAGLAG